METRKTKSQIFEKLYNVIIPAKDTIIKNRLEKTFFSDEDYLKTEGILSESIGLTGLLLLLVAFNKKQNINSEGKSIIVITEQDKADINDITEKSVLKIKEWKANQGYSAEPIVPHNKTKKIVGFETDGYIETITWVLSLCVLIRYASHKLKCLIISSDTEKIIFELANETLQKIMNSQRDDGTWGFMANKSSKKSLYFTYSVGSTLADVYDYIFGELVDEAERTKDDIDTAFLTAINMENLKTNLDNARKKLAFWLLKDCLLYLPQLSECKPIVSNDPIYELLGLWEQPCEIDKKYINLYYVFYIIDLIVVSEADKRYNEIMMNKNQINDLNLQNHPALNEIEKFYLWSCDDHEENLKELWKDYLDIAIQQSRSNFLLSKRTKGYFWTAPNDSQLRIKWEHTDKNISDQIRTQGINNVEGLWDPAYVPLSLRANVNYIYYLIENSDATLDKLYEIVCRTRVDEDTFKSMEKSDAEKCILHLWDKEKYSLLLTIRSIEAIVDYHDYIEEYCIEGEDRLQHTKTEEKVQESLLASSYNQTTKSNIEKEIQKVISSYIQSKDGKAVLKESLDQLYLPKEDVTDYIDTSKIIDNIKNKVNNLKGNISTACSVSDNSISPLLDSSLEYSMKCKIYEILTKSKFPIQSATITEVYSELMDDINNLIEHRVNDISSKTSGVKDLTRIYKEHNLKLDTKKGRLISTAEITSNCKSSSYKKSIFGRVYLCK